MSIRRKFNPNAGDRTYRMILRRSLAPNRNKTSGYADNNHDYADDTPDYSNYSGGDDEEDDDGDEDNSDNEDEDGGDDGNGGGEDEDKNSKGDSNKKNKDDNRDKLRNAEKNGSNSNSNNKNSSLAKRERSSNGGRGFNYNKGRSGGRSGRSGGGGFKGFMGRHKNGVLGGIAGTFVFGGMMSGSMLLSGPTQFIQIMNFIQDAYNTVREFQDTLREAKNMTSILFNVRKLGLKSEGKVGSRISLDDTALLQKYGEVGLLSSNSSRRYAERLDKIGVITKLTDTDIKMYLDHKHLEINWKCKGDDCVAKQVVNKLGGKIKDYIIKGHSIEIDLKEVRNSGGLLKGHNLRKFFADLGRKSGQHFWSRWSGQRAFAKATNIVYGFHPFIRVKNLIKDKIADFLSGIGKKLAAKSKTYAKAVALYNKTRVLFKGLRDGIGAKLSLSNNKDDPEKTKELREKTTQEMNAATDELKSALDTPSDKIRNPMVAKALNSVSNVLNWVGMAISAVCIPIQMAHQIEKFRWVYHVLPAIQLAIEVIASAGQMMAGRMSMAQLSVMSRKQFYDEYTEIPGSDGQFEPSSWWDSAPVNAELGLPINNGKIARVPSEVQSVSAGTLFSKLVGKAPKDTKDGAVTICEALNSQIAQLMETGISVTADVLSAGVTRGASMFVKAFQVGKTVLTSVAKQQIPGQAISLLGNVLIGQTLSMMTGKALDVTNQLPAQFGDIAAYGSKFNQSQNGLHESGGAVLSEKAAAEVNRQKNIWLAEKWNDKPLLAKLFDPTDYRSMLGTLARNARLNPYPENIFASISNTFKLVAAIPNTAVAMAINSPARTALAASGAQRYDYGVPEVAIPPSTLDSFTKDSEDDKSELGNAEEVMKIFHSEETEKAKLREKYTEGSKEFNNALLDWEDTKEKYTELAKVCLAKDIDDDGRVSDDTGQNSENGGFTFMYLTGNSENTDYVDNNCAGKLDKDNGAYDETLARIAMYAGPDIYRARTTECLANPEDSYSQEACVGAGLAYKQGSDGNGPDFGTLTPGGEDSSKVLKRLLQDTNNTLSYGPYSWDGNGCTTVPYWFITKYTTLNACNGQCGNGGVVVDNLVKANKGKLSSPSSTPEAWSIFSVPGDKNNPYGHTGLVTKVDPDGTIHTLEMGWHISHAWEGTYAPNKYQGVMTFAHCKRFLKNGPPVDTPTADNGAPANFTMPKNGSLN